MYRQIFPPVEQDGEAGASAGRNVSADELAKSMPDPPATEPREEGQPDSKKQKLSSAEDEDWENVERPEGSAETECRTTPMSRRR